MFLCGRAVTSRHRKRDERFAGGAGERIILLSEDFSCLHTCLFGGPWATPSMGPFSDRARFFWRGEGLLLGLTVNAESHSGLGMGTLSALLQTHTDTPHGAGQKQRWEERKKKRRRMER